MKYSNQFSDAIHVLAFIAIYQGHTILSSDTIANSIETSAARVRKIMTALKNANLIKTTIGKPQPVLVKEPQRISFSEIFKAISDETPLLQVDHKTNPACIVGGNIQEALEQKYTFLQEKVEQEMEHITLADVLTEIAKKELQKRPRNKKIVAPFLT